MNILFLTPPPLDGTLPAERIFGCNYGIYSQPNIFILYPATILKNAGHSVTCMDFPVMGLGRKDFREFCDTQQFDLICFYTVFLSKKTDLAARDMLHAVNSGTRFLFMSTEPSANPDEFLDERSIALRGESEARILQVVVAIEHGETLGAIPGISFQTDRKTTHTANTGVVNDLDTLPFPDRTLLNSADYANPKLRHQPFTTMVASRGCSFGCYYCVPNSLDFAREIEFKRGSTGGKPPVRLRSAANIVEEFAMLARQGYKSISFIDDQFVWGADRTIEICRGIAPLNIEWSCLARADMLQNRAMVMEMGKAGCRYIDIGIESFSQEILDYIGKGCRVEQVYSAVDNVKAAGIEPELNILLASCPIETEESIQRTFREVLALDVDYVLFSICTPFPYTEFNRRAKAEGWMVKPEYEAIDPIKESFISYPHLPKERLDKIIRELYFRFYFRPSYIWKRIRQVRGRKDFLNKLKAGLSILR